MKKLLLAVALVTVITPAALADSSKRAAVNKAGGLVVRSTNGNCVRTKWDDSNDVCAPAAAPEPAPEPEKVVEKAPEPEPAMKLTQDDRTIYFDFNKSNLTTESVSKLDSIIDAVVASKGVQKVTVVGFADQIGSSDYNLKLSQKRAGAVESYLDEKITIPTDIKTVSAKGEDEPTTSCDSKMKRAELIKCLANDRRVEVQFTYAK